MNTEFSNDNCAALNSYIITEANSTESRAALLQLNFYQVALFYQWLIFNKITDNPVKYLNKYVINKPDF